MNRHKTHRKLQKITVYMDGYKPVKVITDCDRTQMGRAAHALYRGDHRHTWRVKLPCFIRSLASAFHDRMESAFRYHEEMNARDIPCIGIEPERVYELGAKK